MVSQGAEQDGLGEGRLTVAQLDVILRELEHLPARAAVLAGVLEETGDTDNDGRTGQVERLKRITELVGSDPATAAKVVSAAVQAGAASIRTITGAVDYLGADTIRSAVLTLRAAPPGSDDHDALWRHSLAVALAAEALAGVLGLDASEAWLCGLLHDVGKAALLHLFPKSYSRVLDSARDDGAGVLELERRIIGADHAVTGRHLAERWKLPQSCLLYTSPSPRDLSTSRMPSSA